MNASSAETARWVLDNLPNPFKVRAVIAVDANIILKDLKREVEKGGASLLEALHASHARIVMSADDERKIVPNAREQFPRQAEAMLAQWAQLCEHATIVDPAGLPLTKRAEVVRARDQDDVALALVAHVVGATHALTYDQHFATVFPVIHEQGKNGAPRTHSSLATVLRDQGRADHLNALWLDGTSISMQAGGSAIKELAKLLGPRGRLVAGALLGVAGLWTLASPKGRSGLAKVSEAALNGFALLHEHTTFTPEQRDAMNAALAPHVYDAEATPDPFINAARRLARAIDSATTTQLAGRLQAEQGHTITATLLAEHLRRFPGVFTQMSRGRWVLGRLGRYVDPRPEGQRS